MKSILTTTCLIAFLITLIGVTPGFGKKIEQIGMTWYTTLPEGLVAAAKEGKPILLDFWDHRSVAYRQQFETTYKNAAVKTLFSKFVLVTVHISKELDTVRQYHVGQVPTIVFFDKNGDELARHRVEQSVTPEELMERLNSVLGDLRAFEKLKRQVEREPQNLDAALKMGRILEGWLREEQAIVFFKKIAETENADRMIRAQARNSWARALLASGNRAGVQGNPKKAIDTLRNFLELFPKHERVTEAQYMLAMHLASDGKMDEAEQLLQELVKKCKGEEAERAKATLRAVQSAKPASQ